MTATPAPTAIGLRVGQRILLARQKIGLSQVELARRTGVEPQQVSKWECGRRLPNLPTLVALALVLHVQTDFLCGLTDSPYLVGGVSTGGVGVGV